MYRVSLENLSHSFMYHKTVKLVLFELLNFSNFYFIKQFS